MTVAVRLVGKKLVVSFSSIPTKVEKVLVEEFRHKWSSSQVVILPGAVSVLRGLQRRFPSSLEVDPSTDILFRVDGQQSLDERLLPYQQTAVQYLTSSSRPGALLALSPGLGKSAVAIKSAIAVDPSKILVVAPLTLLGTWREEIIKWSCDDLQATQIIRDRKQTIHTRWTITNYDMFVNNKIFAKPWPLIIFDESILLKNRNSIRSKISFDISRLAERVWLLSGSPTSLTIADLFQQFKICRPDIYTSYWRFVEEYCIVNKDQWGWNIVGSKPDTDLRTEFADHYFARSRDEVLDLPPEIHQRISVELHPAQKKVQDRLLNEFILETSDRDIPVPNKVAQIIRLLEVSSNLGNVQEGQDISCKTTAIIDLISTEELPFPTIIWTQWVKSAELLEQSLNRIFPELRVTRLSSDLSGEERDEVRRAFQEGEIDILIASLGVGKFGITLTRAQSYVYYDRSFDADAMVQSSFRVSRLGLDHTVLVYTIVAENSGDQIVDLNVDGKLRDIGRMSRLDWTNLLSSLRGS